MELKTQEKAVLVALYLACRGSTKCNVSVTTINKRLPKNFKSRINTRKILRKLVAKGLVWEHGGRRANGGKTYGLTPEGAKTAKQIIEKLKKTGTL